MAEQIGYQFTADDRKLIEALNRFEHGLEAIRADAKQLSVDTNKAFAQITKGMADAEKKSFGFKKLFSGLIAVDLVRQGVQVIKQAGQAAVGAAANYEQLQVAFTTFLGSADKADKLLKELTETAATTPFQQDQIFAAARQLLAFGIQQEKVNGLIRDLGDISSGVGQPLDRLVLIFGQIQSKSKLTGEELLQLREAGVNPIEELAQVTGKAAHEIEGLITKGQITSEHVAAAFKLMTTEGGRFENLMAKQAETFSGVTSNFRDQVSIILRDFGTELLPTLKEATKDALAFLKSLDPEDIKSFGRGVAELFRIFASLVKQLPFIVAGYVAYRIAVNYSAIATKALTVAQKAFNTASKANPIGLFLGIVLALGPQLLTLAKRLSGTSKVIEEMRSRVKQLKSDFGDETRAVNENIKTMTSLQSTTMQRQAAFDELAAKYPDILAKYDREKISLADLIKLQNELSESISNRILAEEEAKVDKDLFDQLAGINASTPSINGVRVNGFLEDTKAAFQDAEAFKKAAQEKARADQRAKAQEDAKERKRILRETRDDFDELNEEVVVRGGRAFGTLQQQQNTLNKEKQREVDIQKELSGLSSKALRELIVSEETDGKKKAIAQEILRLREAEARANAGNKKELEAAVKAMEAYRDAVKKIADDLAKDDIASLTDPFEKLAAEQKLSLKQVTELFAELKKQAAEVGADVTELTALEARARNQINIEYYRKLDELRKADREKELASFIDNRNAIASIQKGIIDATTTSDGVNTADEIKQVKFLDVDVQQLRDEIDQAKKLGQDFTQLQLDLDAKLRERDKAKIANSQAVLDREEAHQLAQIDLLTESADKTLTLEQFKEQERLKVNLFFAKERLKLLDADSPEAQALQDSIAAIEKGISDLTKSSVFDELKEKLKDLFKIDDAELNVAISLMADAFGQIRNIISDNTQFQIDQNQEIIDAIRDRISTVQDELEKEQEDQQEGYAANVASKKAELEQLKAEEKKHLQEQAKLQKQALKQQLLGDTLAQVSSAITTVFNVTEGLTKALPAPVAIPLIASSLIAIFALIKKFKAESKSLASKALFTGGRIPKSGRSDINGGRGHRIEDTNIIVGAGEHVINAGSSEKHDKFLQQLNRGEYDDMDLGEAVRRIREKNVPGESMNGYRIRGYRPISRDIGEDISRKRKEFAIAQATYEHRLRKEAMKEVFGGEMDRLIKVIEDKADYIPLTDNTTGYIEKKKGRTKKRKFT